MRKNPYLAHYFGTALDSSQEEEVVNAATNFSSFPQSSHMTRRVFRPSQRSESPKESSQKPVCTPPSNLIPLYRQTIKEVSRDAFPSSPPEYKSSSSSKKKLPPLSPVKSRISTPVEVHTGQSSLLHSDASPLPPETSKTIINELPKTVNLSIENREAPSWDSMIKQSHAAISQAKELLDAESSRSPVMVDNTIIVEGKNLFSPINEQNITELSNIESPVRDILSPMQEEDHIPGFDSHQIPTNLVLETSHSNQTNSQYPIVSTCEKSTVKELNLGTSLPKNLEKDENNVSNNIPSRNLFNSFKGITRLDGSNSPETIKSPPIEVKCIVLKLNSDAVACAAKRLTRRPPFASSALQKIHNMVILSEETKNEPQTVPNIIVNSKKSNSPSRKSKKKTSKSNEKKEKDSVISVASLYGILERLAHVVHPKEEENFKNSINKKKDFLDISNDSKQNHNNILIEDGRENSMLRKKQRPIKRHQVPVPQVLMGSAPRIENNETNISSNREMLNITVPTSQLPAVGVGMNGTFPQRSSSLRRSSLNRGLKTPSYALPTESWLYKGADFTDSHLDTSCNIDGIKLQ